MLNYISTLYILEINLFLVASFADIFFHSEGCPPILFMVSFAVQELLSLLRSHLFTFVFVFITLGGGLKKVLLQLISESVLPTFYSKNFIVSGLTFRSLIHFEFIFVHGVRCSIVILLHVAVQFSSTTYWSKCLFSIVYSCLLYYTLGDHRWQVLSLGFLSCSTDLYFCFCANTILFWWLYLWNTVWSQGAWFLQHCFSFSKLLWLFMFFYVSIQIIKYFVPILWKMPLVIW